MESNKPRSRRIAGAARRTRRVKAWEMVAVAVGSYLATTTAPVLSGLTLEWLEQHLFRPPMVVVGTDPLGEAGSPGSCTPPGKPPLD